MTDSSTRIEALDLALLLGSRLCHDLVSPLGAISNGVELMQMGGAGSGTSGPEMQLIADAVEAARARIQTFRMAFGRSGEEQRISGPDLARLLRDMGAQGRLRIDLDADGDQPRREVQMLLLAIMCLESAMPWGGRVLVVQSGPQWRLVGEAERLKADPALWAWLDATIEGDPPQPPSAKVHFALLAEASRAANRPISWEIDESGAEIAF